jgi:hypothetical protein
MQLHTKRLTTGPFALDTVSQASVPNSSITVINLVDGGHASFQRAKKASGGTDARLRRQESRARKYASKAAAHLNGSAQTATSLCGLIHVQQDERSQESSLTRVRCDEHHARKESEEQARLRVKEQARKEAEEQARKEAEEQARKEAAEQARKEAEQQARKEAAEQARKEAAEQARKEAAEQARKDAEEQARKEAAEQARKEADEEERARMLRSKHA